MSAPLPELLITGASGFVGRRLAVEARSRGFAVRAAVRRAAGAFPPGTETLRVAGLDAHTDWSEAVRGASVVMHCAARVHVLAESSPDPLSEYRRVNVEGTLNLARQAAQAGVRRFVFLSSIGVNGEQTLDHPFTEDERPAPESPYAISKHEAEIALCEEAAKSGLQIVVLRAPLIYGPCAKGNWESLVRWVKSGLPLPLGGVRNRRSLLGIDNLVDLMLVCARHPAAANHTFLVSDGEDISTPELVRRLARALGRRALLVPVPQRVLRLGAQLVGRTDLARKLLASLRIDSSRSRAVLGWSPPLSLDLGLERAVAGCRGAKANADTLASGRGA